MANFIAVLLGFLVAALPVLAQAPPSDAQEGTIIRIDKSYSDLPVEYRKPVELTFAYDRALFPDSHRTIDGLFTIGLIDLNDDGIFEVAIRVEHVLYGTVPQGTVLLAHKTELGWRFIGYIEAPNFSQHELIPPRFSDRRQIYVEDKSVGGWRVLNNGPAWLYWHLSGETDIMGDTRYCWAKTAPPQANRYDESTLMGLPYHSGSPGYFHEVYATDPCPKS